MSKISIFVVFSHMGRGIAGSTFELVSWTELTVTNPAGTAEPKSYLTFSVNPPVSNDLGGLAVAIRGAGKGRYVDDPIYPQSKSETLMLPSSLKSAELVRSSFPDQAELRCLDGSKEPLARYVLGMTYKRDDPLPVLVAAKKGLLSSRATTPSVDITFTDKLNPSQSSATKYAYAAALYCMQAIERANGIQESMKNDKAAASSSDVLSLNRGVTVRQGTECSISFQHSSTIANMGHVQTAFQKRVSMNPQGLCFNVGPFPVDLHPSGSTADAPTKAYLKRDPATEKPILECFTDKSTAPYAKYTLPFDYNAAQPLQEVAVALAALPKAKATGKGVPAPAVVVSGGGAVEFTDMYGSTASVNPAHAGVAFKYCAHLMNLRTVFASIANAVDV